MSTKFKRHLTSLQNFALAVIFTLIWVSPTIAATSPDGLWRDSTQKPITAEGRREIVPDHYRALTLTLPQLDNALRTAPAENSDARGVIISLPMPDGSFRDFSVKYSPIMAPKLAAKFPEIKTYIAVATDDEGTNGRLDRTPAGLHAIIFSSSDTLYIDPYQAGADHQYIAYNKRDSISRREPFYCTVTGQKVGSDHSISDHVQPRGIGNNGIIGNTLRTYRIAVAATAEYTAFHGGTISSGMAAIITTMNRVSGIYERELSVRLSLIANNDLLVFTNFATDGYSNNNGFALLTENQTKLDTVIGSENYDIGHVFSTGGGRISGVGIVCLNGNKARGASGVPSPIGDPFVVDYVAHGIGHQFGANHTFNGSTASCAGGNRNAATAYEPGGGTTIMAYAGLCGAEDIQPNSDDYFHTVSLNEISTYIAGAGGSCGVTTATGNTAPTIDAGPAFTVPMDTPLLLIADNAVDPDEGQVITYTWEQFDLGTASPPAEDDGSRPLFRSFKPHSTTIRYLPQMSDIFANTSTLGEQLPTTSRTLTFRLTARDNATDGGGVGYDTVVHQVTTASGPFTVKSQNTPTNWTQGSTQTVTWDVANTTAAPVNCAEVDIYYSINGFPDFEATTLLLNTPNDGTETVTAAVESGTTGRVMLKCSSSIFFDINDAPITVTEDSIFDSGFEAGEGYLGQL